MPGIVLAASSPGHPSRLPSDIGPTKSNEGVRVLLIPHSQGLSHKDRCTHTCEVRGHPGTGSQCLFPNSTLNSHLSESPRQQNGVDRMVYSIALPLRAD